MNADLAKKNVFSSGDFPRGHINYFHSRLLLTTKLFLLNSSREQRNVVKKKNKSVHFTQIDYGALLTDHYFNRQNFSPAVPKGPYERKSKCVFALQK